MDSRELRLGGFNPHEQYPVLHIRGFKFGLFGAYPHYTGVVAMPEHDGLLKEYEKSTLEQKLILFANFISKTN